MYARQCMLLCMASGMASGAVHAQSVPTKVPAAGGVRQFEARSVSDIPINHLYINLRTGERVVTPVKRGTCPQDPVFVNEDIASNGNSWFALDDGTATPPVVGREVVDWGDLEFDSYVTMYRAAYVTNIGASGTGGTGVAGLTMINWFYDGYDGTWGTTAIPDTPVAGFGITEIPGGDGSGGFQGWILTIDLCGSGFEFELGDTDGTANNTGLDLDENTCVPADCYTQNDFAWSYSFDQTGAGPGVIGPFLVLPEYAALCEDDFTFPTGSTAINVDGVEDLLKIYDDVGNLIAVGNFGGWVPSGTTPYASLFIGLYGTLGAQFGCPKADYNGDTVVDGLDLLDFLDDHALCDGQPGPCGNIGNADFNCDGEVDGLDLLDFFDVYGRCSP